MPRVYPSPTITDDRFWEIIEECRRTSSDIFSLDERLVTYLTNCDYPTIIGFNEALWGKCGRYPNSSFRRILREAGHDYSSQNSWQR